MHLASPGMLSNIIQRLLNEAKDRHFVVIREPLLQVLDNEIDGDPILFTKLSYIASQGGHQAQIVEDHWT